jgi:hypothetical protein
MSNQIAKSRVLGSRKFKTLHTGTILRLLLALLMISMTSPMTLPHLATATTVTMIQAPGNACIIEVPSGSFVTGSDSAVFPDGTTHSYPKQDCGTMIVPTVNGYVDQVYSTSSTQFNSITAQWTVPSAPQSQGSQTLYFWNGLEANDLSFILQPVLAFGQSSYTCGSSTCYVGGNYWYLASWKVYSNQAAAVSSVINVNSGDKITGTITWVSNLCGGSGYKVSAIDSTLNQETDLNVCQSTQLTLGLSAVLEAKNISTCSQYPSEGFLDFTAIGSSPTATWTDAYPPTQQPQCAYGVDQMTQIHIHSYPTTDTFPRSHGLSVDTTLPNPWWPPYQSGYEFLQSSSAFDYYTTKVFCPNNPICTPGNHYIQEAASGFLPSYAWHTQIYINGAFNIEGDVARNQPLQASFAVNWTPNIRLFF